MLKECNKSNTETLNTVLYKNYYLNIVPLLYAELHDATIFITASSAKQQNHKQHSTHCITSEHQLRHCIERYCVDQAQSIYIKINNHIIFNLTAQPSTLFSRLVKVAHEFKNFLAKINLECSIMTAHTNNIYIILAVQNIYTDQILYCAAQKMAIFLATKFPNLITLQPIAYAKHKKVLITILAPALECYILAPYSLVQHTSKICVAMPFDLQHVKRIKNGSFFTVSKALDYLECHEQVGIYNIKHDQRLPEFFTVMTNY